MASANTVEKVYKSVIDDVIINVKESFLDEGLDEQVLQELRQLWERKLKLSKSVDFGPKEEPNPAHQALIKQQAQLQHHSQLLQQQQQQQQQQKPQPVQPAQVAHVQLPAFNTAGQFEVSAAAATAQTALGNLLPGSTVTIQTQNGPMQFLIQPQITQQIQQHAQQQLQAQQQAQPQPATISMAIPTTVDPQQLSRVGQLDGANDSSTDDDDDNDDDDDDDDDDEDENKEDEGAEEEALNSADDVSDDESAELFETDNVVVCQFDKIHRNKNKWKFHLKDGIMNLHGKDYVFQKSTGDAEW